MSSVLSVSRSSPLPASAQRPPVWQRGTSIQPPSCRCSASQTVRSGISRDNGIWTPLPGFRSVTRPSAYLCSRVLSSSCGCSCWGWPGGLGGLVVCEGQLRCSCHPEGGPARAERGALDRCRAGAIGVVCARVPVLISVHDLGLAPGRRHDGVGVPAWGRARRSLSLWRPSTRAWRQQNAGSWPRCIGLRRRRARTREAHAGASPSSPRSLRVW